MATHLESSVHINSTTDNLEFMAAFSKAIQDPDQREKIISALESAGLLPLSVRRPA